MKTTNRRDFILSSAALAGSAAATVGFLPTVSAQAQRTKPVRGIEGQKAPEITLDYWIDANGEPAEFSVMASRGKWMLLKCFQNWCPGCHSSGFPTLKAFADEFHDHPDVAIAGIQTVFEGYGSNTQDDVRKLQLRYKLPIIMGHDSGDSASRSLPATMVNYRTGGTPWLILVAPDGTVVFNDFHVNRTSLIEYVRANLA